MDPAENSPPAPFGPFHRLESESQTVADARAQELSGEIWGRVPRHGGWPQVKAYRGPLREGDRGIEFYSFQAPDGPGPVVRWSGGGLRPDVDTEDGLAKIRCVIVRITQTE